LQRYGYFVSNNYYVIVDDPAKTELIFKRLRNDGHYWLRAGHLAIRAIRDLTGAGWDSDAQDGKATLPTSSSSHMLTYKVGGARVLTCNAELSWGSPYAVRTTWLALVCRTATSCIVPTSYLHLQFSNGVVATLRTSGTEPKLKYYTELAGPDAALARQELDRTVDVILDEMLQPTLYNLKRPSTARE
jgi:phosphoglucomutase/phosphopentomutase